MKIREKILDVRFQFIAISIILILIYFINIFFRGCIANIEHSDAISFSHRIGIDTNEILSYEDFKQKQDSINSLNVRLISFNNSNGNDFSTTFLGIRTVNDSFNLNYNKGGETKNFITLSDYYIKPSITFFANGETGYLKFYNPLKENNSDSIVVKYRYDIEKNKLLIPIVKYCFFIYLIVGIQILFMLYFVLYILSNFISILTKISIGKSFEKTNYLVLNKIAKICFLIPFIIIINKLILHLIILNKINNNFELFWIYELTKNYQFYVFGFIVLLLANAFKKGTLLQSESDLTV